MRITNYNRRSLCEEAEQARFVVHGPAQIITRYHASLIENSRMVKEQGLAAFLQQQKDRYTCPECGGIISIHDAECSECQYKSGFRGRIRWLLGNASNRFAIVLWGMKAPQWKTCEIWTRRFVAQWIKLLHFQKTVFLNKGIQ